MHVPKYAVCVCDTMYISPIIQVLSLSRQGCIDPPKAVRGHVTGIDSEVLSIAKIGIQILTWLFDAHAY